ncbi:hypothetical protein TcasGA2_TC012707 [Tribolium castaneum]|uniref:Uncharacterized protein n=1 Tax=Tribolium castaneum TaxID=7070 RepID=D6WZR1_TRICA|nr:hypothetical protein TcasGA2_TC012707 [Tribolium castaneum]
MSELSIGLVILAVLLFGYETTSKSCGEESLYFDEKDIETLKCTLDILEKTYNGTNATIFEDSDRKHTVSAALVMTGDTIINQIYEDVFPEVFCKRCNLKVTSNKLAIVVKCYQCIDTTTRLPTGPTEYKKVFIY